MGNILKVSVKPERNNIIVIRKKTWQFLDVNGFNDDVKDIIAMVISELVENAIQYGKFTIMQSSLDASVIVNEKNIIVEVRNPVGDEDDVHFRRLERIIQCMRCFQNPFEAYIERLNEIAFQTVSESQGGLGIARVVYEGQSVIDFYVNESNIISISAVYHLSGGRGFRNNIVK